MSIFENAVLRVDNLFSLFYWADYFLFFILFYFVYLFLIVTSVLYRFIIVLLFTVISAVCCAKFGGDFFAGFLLTAELPILLVSVLFYFNKYYVCFENLQRCCGLRQPYAVFSFCFICIALYCVFSVKCTRFCFVDLAYFYYLQDYFVVPLRNDFYLWYVFYYMEYQFIIVMVAVFIFFVSYLAVLFYYFTKLYSVTACSMHTHALFVRRQLLCKQAAGQQSLRFFKKL